MEKAVEIESGEGPICNLHQARPERSAIEEDALTQIESALDALEERERMILQLRFGLRGEEPMTLEEIGEHFDLTRERIRQMQNRALAKLRHPSRAHALTGLMDDVEQVA